MRSFRLLAAMAVLAAPAAAQATVVDFEAQANPNATYIMPLMKSQTLTINGATFSGGAIITTNEDFVEDPTVADTSAAYTTSPYSSFTNPLTIAFGIAASNVSFQVVNNIAGSYAVSVNGGAAQNYMLGDFSNQIISVAGSGIKTLSLSYGVQLQAPEPYFDFAIDNVIFTTASAVTAVPEPGTWMMMISGILGVGIALRRRRSFATARFA